MLSETSARNGNEPGKLMRHVQRLLPASLGGLLSWAVYLLAGCVASQDVPRYFAASVAVTIYAEVLARVVKCPATLFLVAGVVPLIPGGSLYATMRFFMEGDFAAFSAQGLNTVMLALAIAVGMLFPTSVFHLIRRTRELMARQPKKQ